MPASKDEAAPTLVSFCAGDAYYFDMAARLREDCAALGVACDIRELVRGPQDDWASICRRKIQFYQEMLEQHPNGILWADVDTKLLRRPDVLSNGRHDIALFLRMFTDLRDFDPVQFTRTFHPGFLHLNNTPKTRRFVAHMARLERESSLRATDDYFLEEAWRSFDEPMALLLLPRDLLARKPEDVTDATCFLFGESGNVDNFIGQVAQHRSGLFDRQRQTKLLKQFGKEAGDAGEHAAALTFFQKAHALDPGDRSAAYSCAKVALQVGQPAAAVAVLQASFGPAIDHAGARQIMVDAALQQNDWRGAQQHLAWFDTSVDPKSSIFARSRGFSIGLEQRASEAGLTEDRRPAVYWQDGPLPGNFGQMVNPYLVEKLSGVPPRRAAARDGIIGSSSTIRLAKPGSVIWGSGIQGDGEKLSSRARYAALRGPLTRQAVIANGGKATEIYGSPALLLPLVFRPVGTKK